jgi:hypothetical protein
MGLMAMAAAAIRAGFSVVNRFAICSDATESSEADGA